MPPAAASIEPRDACANEQLRDARRAREERGEAAGDDAAAARALFRDARRTSEVRGEATAGAGALAGSGAGTTAVTPASARVAGGRATNVGSVHVVSPLRALPQYTRPDAASVYCCHVSGAIAACVRQRGSSEARGEVGDASTSPDD
jgi:hypothetical protein